MALAVAPGKAPASSIQDQAKQSQATAELPSAPSADAARALLDRAIDLALTGKNTEAVTLFDKIEATCSTSKDPSILAVVAQALYCKGETLRLAGKNEEALKVFDDAIRRFGKSPALDQRHWAVWSLVLKGQALADLSRRAEAIAALDEAAVQSGNEPSLAKAVTTALYLKGFQLLESRDSERAIATLDEVVRRLSANGPEGHALIVFALDGKAVALEYLGRIKESVSTYDDAVARYANSTDTDVQIAIAKTLIDKGITLNSADDAQGALGVYDDVIRRFGASKEPDLQRWTVAAHLYRGAALGSLRRYSETRSEWNTLVSQFASSSDPAIKDFVEKAQSGLKSMNEVGLGGATGQTDQIAPVPTLQMALAAPPADLARSYLNAKQLLVVVGHVGAMWTVITPEGTIDKDTAPRWKKVLDARESTYRQAIQHRGTANFAGVYRLASESASCAKANSYFAAALAEGKAKGTRVTVTQTGFELKLKFGETRFDTPSGYAVENTLAFSDPMNMDYTHVGELNGDKLLIRPQAEVLRTWPEFARPPSADDIRNCTIELVREK